MRLYYKLLLTLGLSVIILLAGPHILSVKAQGDDTMIIYARFGGGSCQQTALGDYIKRTLPREWRATDDMDALRAGAIAIRTAIFHPEISDSYAGSYCVKPGKMAYSPTLDITLPGYARTNDATNQTNGVYMTHDGNIINAQMRTENGDPTNPCPDGLGNCPSEGQNCPGLSLPGYYPDRYPYLRGVRDPISAGYPRSTIDCQAVGISQLGSERWAEGNTVIGDDTTAYGVQWNDELQILAHYYTGVEFQGRDIEQWYRWNGLANGAPVWMYPGQTTPIQVQVQNTGRAHWHAADVGVPDLCYRWRDKDPPYDPITAWACTVMTAYLSDMAPGDDGEAVIAITAPNVSSSGNYLLELDLAMEGWWLFSEHGWFGQPKWVEIAGSPPADTTPPTNPTTIGSSSGHEIGVWSGNNKVTITWAGASDSGGSGVRGYSYLWSESPATLPDAVQDRDAGTSSVTTILADGSSWYFHLRTVDNAGNWAVDAAHLGAFMIDTTPPSNPAALSSTSHTVGAWSNDSTIDVIWSGASDYDGSGVNSYSYEWSTDPNTWPDEITEGGDTSATSPPLVDSSHWYFHLRTVDNVGNWAEGAAHLGPFKIDTRPPLNPDTLFSDSHIIGRWSTANTVEVVWSGADDELSGVGGYLYVWDHVSDATPDEHSAFTVTDTLNQPLADRAEWYFHLRTVDHAGNLAASTSHLGPFQIDTIAPAARVNVINPRGYVTSTTFTVAWTGWDGAGSGLANYDVQYRRKELTATNWTTWTGWQTGATATTASFTGGKADTTLTLSPRATWKSAALYRSSILICACISPGK